MSVTVTVEVVETVFAINPVVGIVTLVGGAVVIGVIALFSRSSSSSSQQETREAQTPELEENDAMTFRNANEEMFPRSVFGDNTSRQNCPHSDPVRGHCISHEHESSSETNTDGLFDNCYYTTLAGVLRTSVRRLRESTRIEQLPGGADVNHISYLYSRAGLSIQQIHTFHSEMALYSFLDRQQSIGENAIPIIFGYQTSLTMNHIVALYVRRDPQTRRLNGRIVDFQLPKRHPQRRTTGIPSSSIYYIFDTHGFNK